MNLFSNSSNKREALDYFLNELINEMETVKRTVPTKNDMLASVDYWLSLTQSMQEIIKE